MAICGDFRVAGVYNFDGYGSTYCTEETTHQLRGQKLCKNHWIQGLEARKATDARMASYSRQVHNYNHHA